MIRRYQPLMRYFFAFFILLSLSAQAVSAQGTHPILAMQFKAIKRQGEGIAAMSMKNLDGALSAYLDIASISRETLRIYERLEPQERELFKPTARMASESMITSKLDASSIYCQQKKFDKAEAILNEAGLMAETCDNPLIRRQCVLKLADLKWLSRNYIAAGLLYERLLREQEPEVVIDPRWCVVPASGTVPNIDLLEQTTNLTEALTCWSVYMQLASLYTYINDPKNAFRIYCLPGFLKLRDWLEHVADAFSSSDDGSPQAFLGWAAKMFPAYYHIGKGTVLQRFEQHADALAEFASASALVGNRGFAEVRFSIQSLRGATLQKIGRLDEAIGLFREAVGLTASMNTGIREMAECYACIYLADALLEKQRIDEAGPWIERAEKLARLVDEPRQLWDALFLKGRACQARGQLEAAREAFAESIEQVEKFRALLSLERLKRDYMATRTRVYEAMVRVLLDLGRPYEALSYVERARARAFVDLFGSTDKRRLLKPHEQERLKPEFEKLEQRRMQFDEFQDEIDRQLRGVPGAPSDRRGLEFIQSVGRQADELRKDEDRLFDLAGSEFAAFSTVNAVPLDEIEGLLDSETALIEYYRSPSGNVVWAFAMGADELKCKRPTVVSLSLSDQRLNQEVSAFRDLISAEVGSYTRELHVKSRELYNILVAPLESLLAGKKRLILVLHGTLHFLPFAALEDPNGRALVERFSLVHLPSANAFRFCRQKNRHKLESLLAFAFGASLVENLERLPNTIQEVEAVGALFSPDKRCVIASGSMNAEEFGLEAGERDVIHLATHGLLNPAMPMESAVMLGTEPMKVKDVVGLELHAGLVTLSACQTAMGKIYGGDEIVGLTRSFMYAGTPTVLSSLWPVADASCAELMKGFYKRLMAGSGKDEALRGAQLELRAVYPSPFHWAPFILTGDWE